MELVYLWIEETGDEFNFGSKYIYSYDKEQLTLNLNTEYIENFYSNNVNLSSVIGQNGSGKSQLLKLIWNGVYEDIKGFNKFFAVVLIDDTLKLIGATSQGNNTLSIENETKYSKCNFHKQTFAIEILVDVNYNTQLTNLTTYLFTNEKICLEPIANHMQIASNQVFFSADSIDKKIINQYARKYFNNDWLKPIESYIERVRSSLASYEQSKDFDTDWIENTTKILNQQQIDNEVIILEKKIKNSALTGQKLELLRNSITYEKIISIATDDDVVWFENFEKPSFFSVSFLSENDLENNIRRYLKEFPNILLIYKNLDNSTLEEKIFIFYTLSWYIDLFDTAMDITLINKYLKILNIIENNFDKQSMELFLNNIVDEYSYLVNHERVYFSFAKDYFNNLKIVISKIRYFTTEKDSKGLLLEINSENQQKIKELVDAHIAIVGVSDKSTLVYNIHPPQSSGYYQTLLFIANLYYDIEYKCKEKNILLLLDEIEAYLHPDWQRQFVDLIIKFLSNKFKEKKIHVILASHSPFILSDLTKDRTLVLHKKNKNINQTFGTNIHTLLSNSFFLGENLMGTFSTKKIEDCFNECRRYLYSDKTKLAENKKYYEKNRDELYKIASVIGVEYLKIALLNNLGMIDSQFNINNEDELEKEKIFQKMREKPDWLRELNDSNKS